jgi:hypothetical protein
MNFHVFLISGVRAMTMRRLLSSLAAVSIIASTSIAFSDPRPFSFVSNAYPEGKGSVEYEQYVTYKAHKEDDTGYDRFDFKHELELGLADNFDLGIYLAKWRYENSADRVGTHFDGVAVEGKFYITNPATDLVGIGLFSEIGVSDNAFTFEQKLVLQKDIGDWTIGYNLELETEVAGMFHQDQTAEAEGEIENLLGVSYAIAPQWRLGGELMVVSKYDNWSEYKGTTVYAGPAISYQGGKIGKVDWFVTATPMVQVTNRASEADFQVRVVAGLEF